MTRLGLRHNPRRVFDHPRLPAGHPQRPHVLYAVDRDTYIVDAGKAPGR